MTKEEKLAEKALDREIEHIFRFRCQNIQISILDMPKIFKVAKQARLEGRNMEEAIVSFVQAIRKN